MERYLKLLKIHRDWVCALTVGNVYAHWSGRDATEDDNHEWEMKDDIGNKFVVDDPGLEKEIKEGYWLEVGRGFGYLLEQFAINQHKEMSHEQTGTAVACGHEDDVGNGTDIG